LELLQNELKESQEKCKKMELENKKLSGFLTAAQKSDAETKDMLEKVNHEVRKKMETIHTEYQKVASELKTAKDKSSSLRQELKRVNKQMAETQTAVDTLQTEKVELAEKVQQLQTHCVNLEGHISDLKEADAKKASQLTEVERLLKEKTAAYAAKDAELKMIEAGLDTETKSLFANLSEKNTQLSEKCSVLESDLQKLRAVDECNKEEINSLRKDKDGLQQEIQQHTNWVKTRAMGQINSGDSSAGDVENSAADSLLFGLLLEQLIVAMENKIKTKDEKIRQFSAQTDKLRAQIADLEKSSKLQVAEVTKGLSTKSELEKQLKSLAEEKNQ